MRGSKGARKIAMELGTFGMRGFANHVGKTDRKTERTMQRKTLLVSTIRLMIPIISDLLLL